MYEMKINNKQFLKDFFYIPNIFKIFSAQALVYDKDFVINSCF